MKKWRTKIFGKGVLLLITIVFLITIIPSVTAINWTFLSNFSDDFDDGILNHTLWRNDSQYTAEYSGFIENQAITGSTPHYFWLNKDLNDSLHYKFNFTTNFSATTDNGGESYRINICNKTSGLTWTDINDDGGNCRSIFYSDGVDILDAEHYVIINKSSGNATTYNGDNSINKTKNLAELNSTFYLVFSNHRAAGTSGISSLKNFTAYSDVFVYTGNITTIFGLCNTTLTVPFINFTFKDEEDSTNIAVNVDSASWTYASTGEESQTLDFANTTGTHKSYGFCSDPAYRNITVDVTFKYSNTSYPQRTYALDDEVLTNTTTNTVLYLLNSADGIYSSINTITSAGNVIAGVLVTIEREISGSWTTLGQGLTGDDGLITFWVNPNYVHRITAVKSGYTTTQNTISPSQSLYTLTMVSTSANASYTSPISGLEWAVYPGSGPIKPGAYNFNATITSENTNLEDCKLELLSASNLSNVLASGTNLTNSTHCYISFSYTVVENTDFFGRLSVDTTNTTGFAIVDSDWKWISIDINKTSWRTITSFFEDVTTISEFGEGNKGEFSRIIMFFLFSAIAIGVFNYFTGTELSNPGISIFLLWGLVLVASIGGFLTFDSGSDNVYPTMEKFGFFFILTIFITGYGLNIIRRANE